MADLKLLSLTDRLSKIREQLPLFEKLGWMTSSARNWYDSKLRTQSFDSIIRQAEADLKTEQITTEVLALLQGLKSSA